MLAPPDPAPPAGLSPPAFVDAVRAAVPAGIERLSHWVGDWTLIVSSAHLVDLARHLRDTAGARFDACCDVTAVDWPDRPDRFDIVYSLYSTPLKHRVRL